MFTQRSLTTRRISCCLKHPQYSPQWGFSLQSATLSSQSPAQPTTWITIPTLNHRRYNGPRSCWRFKAFAKRLTSGIIQLSQSSTALRSSDTYLHHAWVCCVLLQGFHCACPTSAVTSVCCYTSQGTSQNLPLIHEVLYPFTREGYQRVWIFDMYQFGYTHRPEKSSPNHLLPIPCILTQLITVGSDHVSEAERGRLTWRTSHHDAVRVTLVPGTEIGSCEMFDIQIIRGYINMSSANDRHRTFNSISVERLKMTGVPAVIWTRRDLSSGASFRSFKDFIMESVSSLDVPFVTFIPIIRSAPFSNACKNPHLLQVITWCVRVERSRNIYIW